MKEIRIHGRGGQGSVTMARILAQAAFEDGKLAQGFPSFGVERLGAPVAAFVRIDDEKITDRSQIDRPDYVIIQDSTLIGIVDVLKGLREGGVVLVNFSASPDKLGLETDEEVITIDATSIALEHLGRPIMNTALAGALSGATGLVSRDGLIKVVKRRFPSELGKKNVSAINAAFDGVR